MSSARLPGKVLELVAGQPLLQYLIDRLSLATGLDSLVVATSDDASDDPIVTFCTSHDIPHYRGSLNDPSERIAGVIRKLNPQRFARICADSPFYDSTVLDELIQISADRKCDIATNVCPRTFPRGQSVEILKSEFFLREWEHHSLAEDREHVTSRFYRSPTSFNIINLPCPDGDLSEINFAIDTVEDRLRMEKMLARMTRDHQQYGRMELVEIYRTVVNP